jgi:Retrotransposon gag protein/Zinc knuckle
MANTRANMAQIQLGTDLISMQEAFSRLKSNIDTLKNAEGNIKLRLADFDNAIAAAATQRNDFLEQLKGIKADMVLVKDDIGKVMERAQEAVLAAGAAAGEAAQAAHAAEDAAQAAQEAQGGAGGRNKNYGVVNTVPIFHGRHEENINFYFTKLEQAAMIGQWDMAEQYLFAKQQLKDDAFEYAESDPKCRAADTYHAFKTAMCDRYRKKETTRFYREQLLSLKKKDSETVEDFADRIKVINVKTYQLGDSAERNEVILEEADQRGLDAFLNGLAGTLGEKVRLAQPKNFQEAVSAAVAVVEVNRRAGNDVGTVKKIFTVERQCYNCNQKGHVRSECRNRPFCYRCKESGHKSDLCPTVKTPQYKPWSQGFKGPHGGGTKFGRNKYQGPSKYSGPERGSQEGGKYPNLKEGGSSKPSSR